MPWLHAVVDVPQRDLVVARDFWAAALGWPAGEPWTGHPELRSWEPPSGTAYVHLQEIEGPARVHLDVEVSDVARGAARAATLGASPAADHDRWTTMRSPGGLPFCLVAAAGGTVPPPATWPDGHRSRMVQVCIDSPGASHDAEVAFWRSLLPGRWRPAAAPEFAGKWHHDESPLQLLFQRLDEAEGPVRAHLDHGSDDRSAEVSRLVALGAEPGPVGRGWQVMRDPAGLVFCVTDNSPSNDVPRDIG